MFKSGFVTIIGKPNVGKSTFVNQLLKQKVAITSSKPQTTRTTIRGIYNDENSQIVFIDTPGIHIPKHKLGKMMTSSALKTLGAVDLVLHMVSGVEPFVELDETIITHLVKTKTPVFLIVNKIDLAKDIDRLGDFIERYKKYHNYAGVFAISALKNLHTNLLIEDIKNVLEEGPRYYPVDQVSDHPEKFMIAELIREKALELTHEEVPHSVTVTIDSMKYDEKLTHVMNIHATIVVERDSQKGIIIGKNGRMIKSIGTKARHDILALLGVKIYLDLHCKVIKNWRNKELYLRNFGFRDD